MTSNRSPLLPVALAANLLLMSGCGGGGGSSGGATAPVPTSGSYAWVLKAQGPTDALKYGLSLVHPGTPDTEYIVESGSSVITQTKLVLSGTVDAAGLKATSVQPYALLYIVGGDVRRVPMQAQGKAPVTLVQRARSTTACEFVVDANDYATPELSRFLVSTTGADGQCGSGDDGRAEVTLGGATTLTLTEIGADAPIGAFRDAATLAPRGWILPRGVSFWGPAPGTTVATRTSTEPAYAAVLASTHRAALVDDGAQLSVLDFPAASTAPTETKLDSVTTGGGGWVGIGFDANSHYAYRSGASTSSTWTLLKINRATPSASVLATGTGSLRIASMGKNLIYATVVGNSDNRLLAISKTSGVPVVTVEASAPSTLTSVQTSANDVHELWRIVNIGTAAVNYTIEMIDEAGNKRYSTSAGGFAITPVRADNENFNASESRTRFVFAEGYGSRAYGDATLVGYDTTTQTARTFGTLPGSADFGTDFVFTSLVGGPGSFMGGFAARSSGGVVQSDGAKVFSIDFATRDSLSYVTTHQ